MYFDDSTSKTLHGWLFCRLAVIVGLVLVLPGCRDASEPDAFSSDGEPLLRIATTTSTRDSGLLEALMPAFVREHSCRVDMVAVGTGAALKLGEAGDVDVLLVHAPEAEQQFMAAEHGSRRVTFMVNDFVLLGPPDDPAQANDAAPVVALQRIADAEARFISRGDDSGTHQRETMLWRTAGVEPTWSEYVEAGQGMVATLMMADEKMAYVLCDRGTFLRFRDKIDLRPVGEGQKDLLNPYSVIVVSQQKHPHIQLELAEAFADYLISPEAQQTIADYQVEGEPLFRPAPATDERNAPASSP